MKALTTSARWNNVRLSFCAFVIALVALFGFASNASADQASAPGASGTSGANANANAAPRDVPVIAAPESVEIPAVPSDFAIRDLGWLKIAYPPAVESRVAPLIKDAEDIRAALGEELGQAVLDHVQVRVARSPEEMAALSPVGLPPPAYASGVAYPPLHLVALTLRAPDTSEAPDLDEVFRHELSHIALEDATLGHHVPRWFNEGLAVYESGERPWVRMKTLGDASLSNALLPLSELDRGFPNDKYEVSIAYAESADFVRFLFRRADRQRAIAMIGRVRQGEPFERSLADAYGVDSRKLEFEWKQELDKRFTIWPVVTGGSLIWVVTCGVLAWAYIARRKKSKQTLDRWEREEALAEARRIAYARAAEEAMEDAKRNVAERRERERAEAEGSDGPAHAIAVTSTGEHREHGEHGADRPHPASLPPAMVEHDGSWHVLH